MVTKSSIPQRGIIELQENCRCFAVAHTLHNSQNSDLLAPVPALTLLNPAQELPSWRCP